jgi:hypothetical protein
MLMKKEAVKLLTTQEGTRIDYVEPSVVCAAQHALSILENEEGSLHAIEVNGKLIWSNEGRKSVGPLEELAVGVCVK